MLERPEVDVGRERPEVDVGRERPEVDVGRELGDAWYAVVVRRVDVMEVVGVGLLRFQSSIAL
jgi:hypothetical protein